jgi:hypothetical protein
MTITTSRPTGAVGMAGAMEVVETVGFIVGQVKTSGRAEGRLTQLGPVYTDFDEAEQDRVSASPGFPHLEVFGITRVGANV